ADLAAAAGEAQDAARLAADDLARQTMRLETAGTGVAEQIRSVEESLSQSRAALVAAAYALRTDQEDFSAQVETQRAQLTEALSHTRLAAGDLGETSAKGAEAMRDLVQGAAVQFRELAEMSEAERHLSETRTREAIERLADTAAQIRDELVEDAGRAVADLSAAAEEARRSADASVESARARVDRLGEAAFEAGKRADDAFDSRMNTARRLIDESSALVEEAGERAGARLDSNLNALRGALIDVESALGEIDQRVARLPREAQAHVADIKEAVEQGLEALASAARRAAEETESVDAAFQDRVKRNYEMLSETVRMMGMVSGDNTPAPRMPAPSEAPARRERRPEPEAPAAPPAGLRPR
ncbi:tipN, partial [Caulobacter sp. 17J65-9]|nr:tipN [Caulobacter sp. 17J65-9]